MFFGLGRAFVEWMIGTFTPTGKATFFEPATFPWVAGVEADWESVLAELEALLVHRDRIPNIQDLSEDQKVLTTGEQWKTFFLYMYGEKAQANCERCPRTARVLAGIPGMKTAMFSILAPGKHLPEHRGPWKGVLRYHLGLIVPQPYSLCAIRVGGDLRHWEPGKSLVFDDSHPHEAWNNSDQYRAVLFVDFVRPLWFPLSLANRVILWRIATSPFVTVAMERIRAISLRRHPPEG
jgi:beta-hydroxylase